MTSTSLPVVVIVSGLNGTGKTTLAGALRALLGATDTMLIGDAVDSGRSVVVEGVFADDLRQGMVVEATAAGAKVVIVECVCSDELAHQQRVEDRWARGDSRITWSLTEQNMRRYKPYPAPHYRADALQPVEVHLAAISALL